MKIDIVFDFARELTEATQLEQVRGICQRFCQLFHIDTYAYLLRIPTSLSQPSVVMLQNYPHEWVAAYQENNFIKDDPVIAYANEHLRPALWSDIARLDQYKKRKSRVVMNEAQQFGLKEGFVISYSSPSGDLSLFSLSFNAPAAEVKSLINEAVMPAQHISGYLYEAVKAIDLASRHDQGTSLSLNITGREKECLLWACEGKTAWEMSNILGISERTAIFHLNNATAKLGASNRQHAVAKAVLMGIIKPEFCFDE